MSKNFIQSAFLRDTGLAALQLRARLQFWRTGPRVFVNSIPKAGTHLLTAELAKFSALQNSYLHIKNQSVRRDAKISRDTFIFDGPAFERQAAQVRGGQYFSSHLFWSEELEAILSNTGIRTLFVIRDPRDILVSRYHYIMGLKRHHLQSSLNDEADDIARYKLMIEGRDGDPYIWDYPSWLAGYSQWSKSRSALIVKFEDLVGAKGNGSLEAKTAIMQKICQYLEIDSAEATAAAATDAPATPTLRKGKANAWRESMPPEIIELVHATCGQQIIDLGYEL